jgi:hypothetical protein
MNIVVAAFCREYRRERVAINKKSHLAFFYRMVLVKMN